MYVNTLSSTEKKKNLFISIHIYIYMVWDFTYINSFCFAVCSAPTLFAADGGQNFFWPGPATLYQFIT